MLPLFMVAGLLMYYRSDFGRRQGWLLGAGFMLGLGAGLKLHLAFAVILLLGDLVRVHGLRTAVRLGWAFALLSLLAFAVSAGIPLFDPLKYVKLRVTNAKDDASPWIKWGEQFITMLRGGGWVALPLALGPYCTAAAPRSAAPVRSRPAWCSRPPAGWCCSGPSASCAPTGCCRPCRCSTSRRSGSWSRWRSGARRGAARRSRRLPPVS
jgi:hypothetical protein